MARSEVGWVIGWTPEIVSLGVILYFFGFHFTRTQVLVFLPFALFGLWCFGYFWRRSGLYEAVVMVNKNIDPVQSEIYKAAQTINKAYDKMLEDDKKRNGGK